MLGRGVILASGLVFGLLDNDVRLVFSNGRTDGSVIDTSQPLVEPPVHIPEGPEKALVPPPVLALAICRGDDLGIDILTGKLPMTNAISNKLSLSCDLALAIVSVKVFAPFQTCERGWVDSNSLFVSMLR